MKRHIRKVLTIATTTAALGTSLGVAPLSTFAADKVTLQEKATKATKESTQTGIISNQDKMQSVQGKVEAVQGKVEAVQEKTELQQGQVSNQIKESTAKAK